MNKKSNVSIIVAVSDNNVIGINNDLPWKLPADLQMFKNITMGHNIIMGRKTYESIGRPLPGRNSIVITRQVGYVAPGCVVVNSIDEALNSIKGDVFIIGGAEFFKYALDIADKLYITRVEGDFDGDVFFPVVDYNKWNHIEHNEFDIDDKNKHKYSFNTYIKKV